MNKVVKIILLGLLIWVIPFLASVFVWDPDAGVPRISMELFSALMAFTWGIGFSIALYSYFKDVKGSGSVAAGWLAGIIWYVELLLLDLIVLVGFFGMELNDYYPFLLTYMSALFISVAVGHIKK